MFVVAHIRSEVDEVDEAMRRQTTDGDGNDDNDDNDNDNDDNYDNDNDMERGASKGAKELISSSLSVPPIVDGGSSLDSEKGKKIFGVSTLRSQQPPVTLGYLESLGAEDPSFRNFRARLATWINRTFPMYGCPFAPGLSRVALQADDKVSFASGPVW